MKKVLASLLVFIFMLSLAACGDTENASEEGIRVNNALDGSWYLYYYTTNLGMVIYAVTFDAGKYVFGTYPDDSLIPYHSEAGTYSIDVNKHEILCKSEDGLKRSFSYEYNSGDLSLSSSHGQYTKSIY